MPAWNTLIFEYGSEWAPDSPYGVDVLELSADGRIRYENRHIGRVTHASGRMEAGALADVARNLSEAGFPAVPPHSIPPGSSLVELRSEGEDGSHTALLDYFAALEFPGYGALIRNLATWADWFRKGPGTAPAPPGISRD